MSTSSDLIKSLASLLGLAESDVVIVTTSVAVLIGLSFFIAWRRSSNQSRELKPIVPSKVLPVEDEEEEVEGKTKVTVFFGTQTGTAEGFAKVIQFSYFILGSFCVYLVVFI